MHIENLDPDIKAAIKTVSKKKWEEFFETLRQSEYKGIPHAIEGPENPVAEGETERKSLTAIKGCVRLLNEMEFFFHQVRTQR